MRILPFMSVVASVAILLHAQPAAADVSEKDFQVVSKAVSFLKSPPSGDVVVAIVHDPGNAASKAEADALNGILGGGLAGKGMTFKPKLVATSNVSQAGSAGLIFVTTGVGAHHSAIGGVAKSAGVIAVSTDKSCATSGGCSMYVQSSPKVEIAVNKAAAAAAGVEFQSAFQMMITEM